MIWLGHQQSYELKKYSNVAEDKLVIADLENEECRWLAIPPHHLTDSANPPRQFSELTTKVMANRTNPTAPSPACLRLLDFKLGIEAAQSVADIGLPDYFFVHDKITYREFVGKLYRYGGRARDDYIANIFLKPITVFLGSWLVFAVVVILVKWLIAGFRTAQQ